MPRKKNLDLADALGEDIDVTEAEAIEASQIVAAPVAAPVVVPSASQPITLTFEQLQALMTAQASSSQAGTDALAKALTQGIKESKTGRPQNEHSPEVSVLNPLGDRDFPRPGLKCEFFLGTQDAKTGIVARTYPFMPEDLTAQEQIALNTLEPQEALIELLDGAPAKVTIVPTRDPVTNAITRMVLVLPAHILQKGSQQKNMLPSICNLVAQITGKNFGKLSHDDLAWFMAEHRAKRYVAVRESVAA